VLAWMVPPGEKPLYPKAQGLVSVIISA